MYVFLCDFLQNASACKYYVKTHAFAPQTETDNTTKIAYNMKKNTIILDKPHKLYCFCVFLRL